MGKPKHRESPQSIRTPEYNTWRQLRQRCNCETHHAFKYYGGRGIKVCERWGEYENFLEDMGRKPDKNYSIDRIDKDGDYSPENCRWTCMVTQNNNRSNSVKYTYNGETKSIPEFARQYGLNVNVLYNRVRTCKWPIKKAIEVPVRKRNKGFQ